MYFRTARLAYALILSIQVLSPVLASAAAFSVTGTVTGATSGQPMGGVIIYLSGGSSGIDGTVYTETFQATTDDAGRYQLVVDIPSGYHVDWSPSLSGHTFESIGQFRAASHFAEFTPSSGADVTLVDKNFKGWPLSIERAKLVRYGKGWAVKAVLRNFGPNWVGATTIKVVPQGTSRIIAYQKLTLYRKREVEILPLTDKAFTRWGKSVLVVSAHDSDSDETVYTTIIPSNRKTLVTPKLLKYNF